jgi:hypothetical protein
LSPIDVARLVDVAIRRQRVTGDGANHAGAGQSNGNTMTKR